MKERERKKWNKMPTQLNLSCFTNKYEFSLRNNVDDDDNRTDDDDDDK